MRAQCHTARGGHFELCGSLSPQRPALSRCVIVGPQHKPCTPRFTKVEVYERFSQNNSVSYGGGGGMY